jgi:hypothetical protein
MDNCSAGAPLVPEEYARVLKTQRAYDDRELTAALVDARAPRATIPDCLHQAPAVAFAAGAAAHEPARIVSDGLAKPPSGTRLRRNPIYLQTGALASVNWPSARYAREHAALATYPDQVTAGADAIAGDPAVEALVRRRVYVDLPARW